jgi:uncharacterized membrane protein YgdD (TMEM256/DUF423 family)
VPAERLFALVGALFAFAAVAVGAFAAHALAPRLTPDRLALVETAARYQMYHALALFVVAWAAGRWQGGGTHLSGWLFVAGTLIFCGTLYALAAGAPRWLGALTPAGGLALLGGWLALAIAALRG